MSLLQNIQNTSYNARKAVSQGLLDAALFLSNVAQLKSIFDGDLGAKAKAKVAIAMIVLSLILQFTVGILLIMILDIEGCLVQLKQIGVANGLSSDEALAEEVTNMEPTPDPPGVVADRKFILTRRARRINTAILCFILGILCLNFIINGLDLGKPNNMEELLKAYNITLKH